MKPLHSRTLALTFALAFAPLLGACGGDDTPEPVDTPPANVPAQAMRVTNVELGSSIDADRRVNDNAATDDFGPNDTIYASVATEGGSGGSLSARWTFEDGQVVEESSQSVSSTAASVTEFHISKPDGFPAGDYSVEIGLNGQTVETREFEVE